MKIAVMASAAMAAIMFVITPSLGQEAPPSSGAFELRYTWVNPTTSAFGVVAGSEDPTSFAEAGAWVAWLMTSDGSDGFGHEMTGRCIGMSRQAGGVYQLVAGDCVYTDGDGDQLFERYDGLVGTWTGGTGKYTGIHGTFDLTDIIIRQESGYTVMTGVKVGNYTIE